MAGYYDQNYTDEVPLGMTERDVAEMQRQQALVAQSGGAVDNPFESEQYRDIRGSEAPIQYGGGMAEILLNNDAVPKPIRTRWWNVFNNDVVLTFLNKDTKRSKLISYDIGVIDIMDGMESYFDYRFEDEAQYNLVRNALDTKLDRAMGTRESVKNERIIMQSQFSENKAINEVSQQQPIKEGFFKRLLGRR